MTRMGLRRASGSFYPGHYHSLPAPLKETEAGRQVRVSHLSSQGLWLGFAGCLCSSNSVSHSQKRVLEKLKGNAWMNK